MVQKLLAVLKKAYPTPQCALHYETPLQMLIATMLSAQSTDKMVNLVTPDLFSAYPDAHAFATADIAQVAQKIKRLGLFRSKARNVVLTCQRIVSMFNGKVPSTMQDLVSLPGVGRKTANVVLGEVFGKAIGVVVDTHVKKFSWKMGLSEHRSAEKIEQDLMTLLPQEEWREFTLRVIDHGRDCTYKKQGCHVCSFVVR